MSTHTYRYTHTPFGPEVYTKHRPYILLTRSAGAFRLRDREIINFSLQTCLQTQRADRNDIATIRICDAREWDEYIAADRCVYVRPAFDACFGFSLFFFFFLFRLFIFGVRCHTNVMCSTILLHTVLRAVLSAAFSLLHACVRTHQYVATSTRVPQYGFSICIGAYWFTNITRFGRAVCGLRLCCCCCYQFCFSRRRNESQF